MDDLTWIVRQLGLVDVDIPELGTPLADAARERAERERAYARDRSRIRHAEQRAAQEALAAAEEEAAVALPPLNPADITPEVWYIATHPADTLQRMLPVELRIRIALWRQARGEKQKETVRA